MLKIDDWLMLVALGWRGKRDLSDLVFVGMQTNVDAGFESIC
jgi:hypothetical protein